MANNNNNRQITKNNNNYRRNVPAHTGRTNNKVINFDIDKIKVIFDVKVYLNR